MSRWASARLQYRRASTQHPYSLSKLPSICPLPRLDLRVSAKYRGATARHSYRMAKLPASAFPQPRAQPEG